MAARDAHQYDDPEVSALALQTLQLVGKTKALVLDIDRTVVTLKEYKELRRKRGILPPPAPIREDNEK